MEEIEEGYADSSLNLAEKQSKDYVEAEKEYKQILKEQETNSIKQGSGGGGGRLKWRELIIKFVVTIFIKSLIELTNTIIKGFSSSWSGLDDPLIG